MEVDQDKDKAHQSLNPKGFKTSGSQRGEPPALPLEKFSITAFVKAICAQRCSMT